MLVTGSGQTPEVIATEPGVMWILSGSRCHSPCVRTGIQSPTLVIQGDDDLMIPPKLSHLMAGLIPDAQIRIYADAARGFLFQYPVQVAADINAFLAPEERNGRSRAPG